MAEREKMSSLNENTIFEKGNGTKKMMLAFCFLLLMGGLTIGYLIGGWYVDTY